MVPVNERETTGPDRVLSGARLGLNGLLSAVVLMAEWRLRETPNIPVPYVYPVDLRYVLSPPVSATACTNPVGMATYLAEIDHKHRCCRSRPRHRRDFPEGPVRRGDSAVVPSLQPAVRRQSARFARRRHVHRQRSWFHRSVRPPIWRITGSHGEFTSASAQESISTPARYSPIS